MAAPPQLAHDGVDYALSVGKDCLLRLKKRPGVLKWTIERVSGHAAAQAVSLAILHSSHVHCERAATAARRCGCRLRDLWTKGMKYES